MEQHRSFMIVKRKEKKKRLGSCHNFKKVQLKQDHVLGWKRPLTTACCLAYCVWEEQRKQKICQYLPKFCLLNNNDWCLETVRVAETLAPAGNVGKNTAPSDLSPRCFSQRTRGRHCRCSVRLDKEDLNLYPDVGSRSASRRFHMVTCLVRWRTQWLSQ